MGRSDLRSSGAPGHRLGDTGLGDIVLSPWVISWMTITFGDMLGDHGSPGRYVIPTPHAQGSPRLRSCGAPGERFGDLSP